MDICQNCERNIGNLEPAYVFQEHVVCADCFAKLTNQTSNKPPPDPITPKKLLYNNSQYAGPVADKSSEHKGKRRVAIILIIVALFLFFFSMQCYAQGNSYRNVGYRQEDNTYGDVLISAAFIAGLAGIIVAAA